MICLKMMFSSSCTLCCGIASGESILNVRSFQYYWPMQPAIRQIKPNDYLKLEMAADSQTAKDWVLPWDCTFRCILSDRTRTCRRVACLCRAGCACACVWGDCLFVCMRGGSICMGKVSPSCALYCVMRIPLIVQNCLLSNCSCMWLLD